MEGGLNPRQLAALFQKHPSSDTVRDYFGEEFQDAIQIMGAPISCNGGSVQPVN